MHRASTSLDRVRPIVSRGLKNVLASVTRKKFPNVYKSCPKLISPLQKLPKMWAILKKKLPKVQ